MFLWGKRRSRYQVELESGKRVKVKSANILLKFEKPQPAELLAQAGEVAQGIDLMTTFGYRFHCRFGGALV